MIIHKGKCRDCGLSMVAGREWNRNRKIRSGRKKYGGFDMCQACYVRARRHGRLPDITIIPRYPVVCDQCGPVTEPDRWDEAHRIRAEHLAKHGFGPVTSSLPDAELARLRRMVGVA
jgi:NMD protein affecting ribosome stability and mRNA decay